MADKDTLDIRYADLTRDTVATVRRVSDFVGVPFDADAEERIRGFVAESPLQKQGSITYRATEFGLDDGELREPFAAYHREHNP
jgi:hypothetical protein